MFVGLVQVFGVFISGPEFKLHGIRVCEFHPNLFLTLGGEKRMGLHCSHIRLTNHQMVFFFSYKMLHFKAIELDEQFQIKE